MSEFEPMGFREAIRHGLDQQKESRESRRYEEKQYPRAPGFLGVWYAEVPSLMASDPINNPSLKRAAEVLYEYKRRDKGEPYNEALIVENELSCRQWDRFEASKWSKLFPKLANMSERKIKLNI